MSMEILAAGMATKIVKRHVKSFSRSQYCAECEQIYPCDAVRLAWVVLWGHEEAEKRYAAESKIAGPDAHAHTHEETNA